MRGVTLVESLVIGLIVLIAGGLIFSVTVAPFLPWHLETAHGEHTGYITAVENTGLVWHTNTAYVKTDTQSSQEDKYCVTDPEVFAALKEAADTKAHVTVSYLSWLNAGVSYCKSEEAVITGVRVITP